MKNPPSQPVTHRRTAFVVEIDHAEYDPNDPTKGLRELQEHILDGIEAAVPDHTGLAVERTYVKFMVKRPSPGGVDVETPGTEDEAQGQAEGIQSGTD